jgi:hypothetical protein
MKDTSKISLLQNHIPVEEFCLLGYNTVYSVKSQPKFRRSISPPSSGNQREGGGKQSPDSWPSETSVVFQLSTRRYIPEDRTLHNHRCENLKFSYTHCSELQNVHSMLEHLLLNCVHVHFTSTQWLYLDRVSINAALYPLNFPESNY